MSWILGLANLYLEDGSVTIADQSFSHLYLMLNTYFTKKIIKFFQSICLAKQNYTI
jgi:hypothetical protein